jgi:hypothetical protein
MQLLPDCRSCVYLQPPTPSCSICPVGFYKAPCLSCGQQLPAVWAAVFFRPETGSRVKAPCLSCGQQGFSDLKACHEGSSCLTAQPAHLLCWDPAAQLQRKLQGLIWVHTCWWLHATVWVAVAIAGLYLELLPHVERHVYTAAASKHRLHVRQGRVVSPWARCGMCCCLLCVEVWAKQLWEAMCMCCWSCNAACCLLRYMCAAAAVPLQHILAGSGA